MTSNELKVTCYGKMVCLGAKREVENYKLDFI